MRPHLYAEYKEILSTYQQEGFGIYDDTPDLNRAIAWSDAYFGDGSSLVPLYQATGKPVLFQRLIPNYNSERAIIFFDFKVKDNILWGVCWYMNMMFANVLFAFDLESNSLKHYKKPLREQRHNYYLSLTISGDNIVMIPAIGKNVIEYNTSTDSLEYVPIESNIPYQFEDSYAYGKAVYIIPYHYPALLKYDLESGKMTANKELCVELEKYRSDEPNAYFHKGGVVDGSFLMLASGIGNIVVKYDMANDTYQLYHVGATTNKYNNITFDGTNYWLLPHRGAIVQWNEQSRLTAEITALPAGFQEGESFTFKCSVIWGNSVFVFPYHANMIIKIDCATNETETFANLDERERRRDFNDYCPKYLWAERVGDYIYASSLYEMALQKINPQTGEIENIPLVMSEEAYGTIFDDAIFNSPNEMVDGLWQEFEDWMLTPAFFLDRLAKETINKEQVSLAYLERCASNIDGTCGEKTYGYVKTGVFA
jgi:hypothetical protein